MFGVVAYFCPFVFTQKPPPPAAVIDFLCKARIQNFLINSISVRRAVERDCQTRACSNLTITGVLEVRKSPHLRQYSTCNKSLSIVQYIDHC